MKKIILILAPLLLMCCDVQTVFVVVRNVPQYPTFVVMPANDYLYQHEFANQVENWLLGSGVKVLSRPSNEPTKEVRVTKQAEGISAQSGRVEGGLASVTERFFVFQETEADYAIFTYADAKQVQIVKRNNQEILASFAIKPTQDYSGDQIFRDALRNLGIRVLNRK